MVSAAGSRGGGGLPWTFIHDTDIEIEALKLLFFGFFPLAHLEEA